MLWRRKAERLSFHWLTTNMNQHISNGIERHQLAKTGADSKQAHYDFRYQRKHTAKSQEKKPTLLDTTLALSGSGQKLHLLH